jgi:hypothetical protein
VREQGKRPVSRICLVSSQLGHFAERCGGRISYELSHFEIGKLETEEK